MKILERYASTGLWRGARPTRTTSISWCYTKYDDVVRALLDPLNLFNTEYGEGQFDIVRRTQDALSVLNVTEPGLHRAARCRWLDVLMLDGSSFGRDESYTQEIRRAQPDPWFFANIALDLKQLDPLSGAFVEANVYPFVEIKRTLNGLRVAYLISCC